MKNLLKPLLLLGLCASIVFSCKDTDETKPTSTERKFDGFPEGTRPNSTGAFANSGSKWNKCNLTYHIVRASNKPNISASAEMQAYRDAFKAWENVSGLKFQEVFNTSQADIVINHKDEDGPNGVLGYAYFPCETNPICGDIFFDDSETWTLEERSNSAQPIDLYSVALHEIGHAIGLGHSSVPESVMFWAYSRSKKQLHPDDIAGVNAIYGNCGGNGGGNDDLSKGLVLHLPFNGNAQDISGNNNHGTVFGVTLTTDRKGNPNSAYYFDGIDDWIRISDNEKLRPSIISISAWVNREVLQPNSPASIFYKGEKEVYALHPTNFSIKQNSGCLTYDGTGWQSVTTNFTQENTNTWYHVVGVFDGTSLKFYRNGTLLYQRSNLPKNQIDNCSGGNFRIGRWHDLDPSFFKGRIDDIRIYNRALTTNEINRLYQE